MPKTITNLSQLDLNQADRMVNASEYNYNLKNIMDDHFENIIEHLTAKHGLTENQASELERRLSWQLVLLPQ